MAIQEATTGIEHTDNKSGINYTDGKHSLQYKVHVKQMGV